MVPLPGTMMQQQHPHSINSVDTIAIAATLPGAKPSIASAASEKLNSFESTPLIT